MEAQVNFKQVHMVAVVQTIWVHQVLYLTTFELCYFQFVVIYTSALLELKKEYFFIIVTMILHTKHTIHL